MYNGIGLQTARGSGTNGYIQTNKFFVRPKTGKVAETTRGFEADQGTAGVTRKPNKDILEHDRKRQIELKLVVIEDKLIDQGYTDAEIAEKLAEVRKTLQAAAISEESGGSSAIVIHEKKVSDTQTHQIAARKEKQMETLRAALGIAPSDLKEQNTENDDLPKGNGKSLEDDVWKHQENPEHAFLDRDETWKKQPDEDQKADKDIKKLATKWSKGNKMEESKKNEEYYSDSGGKRAIKVQKKHHKRKAQSSDSDSGADKKYKAPKKHKKNIRQHSDDSDSVSDVQDNGKGNLKRKVQKYKLSSKKHYSDDDPDTGGGSPKLRIQKEKQRHESRRRHDSEDEADTSSEMEDKGQHHKKKNMSGGRDKQERCDSDVEGLIRGYSRPHRRHSGKHGEDRKSDSADSEKYKETTTKENRKSSRRDTDDDSDVDSDEKVDKHKSRGHGFNDKESNKGKEGYGSKSGNSGRSKLNEDFVSRSKHGISDDCQDDEKEYEQNAGVKNNRSRTKNYGGKSDEVKHKDEGHGLGLEKNIKSGVVRGDDEEKEKLSYYDRRDTDTVSRSHHGSEDHFNKRKLEDRNDDKPLIKSRQLNSGIESEYHERRGKDYNKKNESPTGRRPDLDLEVHEGGRRYRNNEEVHRDIKHTRDEYDHISRKEEKDGEERAHKSRRLGGDEEDRGRKRDVNYVDIERKNDSQRSEKASHNDSRTSEKARRDDSQTSERARRDDSRTSERARHQDSRTSEMTRHDDSRRSERARRDEYRTSDRAGRDEYRTSERAYESNKRDDRRT